MKILLDPGHGGDSFGTLRGKIPEKDINLKVSLMLYEELKGFTDVDLTRFKDENLSLRERLKIVNNFKPDIFISIHHNASEEDTKFYSEVYTSWGLVSPSYDLGYFLQNEICKVFPERGFRVLPSKFTVLKAKAKIKVLTELFFAEEMDDNLMETEVRILKNAIMNVINVGFARERDLYRSFGRYSQPKGYLTTNFGKGVGKLKSGKWVVVLGDGRLFWDAVELVNRIGGKLYHFGMSVQPSQFITAMKIVKAGFKRVIFLRYGEPYVRFYHTSKESGELGEMVSKALNYPLGYSSSYIVIHPDGIRLEIITKDLNVELLSDVINRSGV